MHSGRAVSKDNIIIDRLVIGWDIAIPLSGITEQDYGRI
jgi:hypothetical protein